MRTIMVELFDDGLSLSNDTLGRAGEKNIVQFSINFDALRYTGLTTATLLYKPRNSPVLAMPSVDIPASGRLISQVPDWAMSMFGVTQVQLQLTGEGVETRSYIWNMRVERSLINYGDKPTPVQDWLEEVTDIIDRAASLTGFKVIDYFDTYDELIAAITDPVPGAAYGVGTAAPYDVYVYGETSGWTNIGPIAVGGGGGESIVFVPSISEDGLLTWENNGDLPNPAPINIKGPKGDNGGAIFIPSVSDDGVLSWTNTGGLNNPPNVNLMGKDGKAPKITVRSVSTGYELVIDHPDGIREVVPIKNGSAPSVVVEEIDGGHRITFYGGNGPKSIDVMDGKDGDKVTAETVKAALGYTPANEDNVPEAYTLPTASADTLGGVKIGDGLHMDGDVLSAKESVYELIETITIEEEGITQIVRTPVSFDAVIVTMMAQPRSAGKADAFVRADTNTGKSIVVGSSYIHNTETYSSRYDIYKNANLWDGKSSGAVKGWGGGNTLGTNNASNIVLAADGEYINYLRLYVAGSGTYPVGTVIKIYGVRADA